MLVIISDLHLTDGTSGATISTDAFTIFADKLRQVAYRASWRADGVYRPIDSFDLVLLGDVFDYLRSTRWFDEALGDWGSVRPWHDPEKITYIEKIQDVTQGILARNAPAFALLKQLAASKIIQLPPATDQGAPDEAGEKLPVAVHIHYMVGNHDWFLHLTQTEYEPLRAAITAAMGLANPPGPFPHSLAESPRLSEIFRQHEVYARHGDIYDSCNYNREAGRNASTLGDALTIDLFGRFPVAVREQMEGELPQEFCRALEEITNVRPALLVPVWINGLMERNLPDKEQRLAVQKIWNQQAEAFLAMRFVRSMDNKLNPFDKIDALERLIKITKHTRIEKIGNLAILIKEKIWGGHVSFAKHALAEEAFRQRTARYIVYGHTHSHEIIPLDSNLIDGRLFDQVYINSGTWHAVHDPTVQLVSQKFVAQKVMTYLSFFKDDERGGRPFESWNGTLSWPYNRV